MRSVLAPSLAVAVGAACAGGPAGPLFEYGPSEVPLRYEVTSETNSAIETPMGPQNVDATTNVTLTFDIGEQSDGGRRISVVIEALESQSTGIGRLEGGELIGQAFVGVLAADGSIEFTGVPETPANLRDYFDPAAFLSELLMPLPPAGGDVLESWPVHQETIERTQMTMMSTFDGTARVTGDTTWNGQPAKIVMVEGQFELAGTGTPTGSPGELEMLVTGPATTTYLWDAARGVMLSATSRGEGEGTVALLSMDITMPVTVASEQSVVLQR
ncbi:MAG: hypothetical protein JSW71_18700 [Gemmatimonadota bacterium]|nr:MAG: hypothetical protein JSW71_18700 [Gemmatimonadota bacterium]